MRNNGERDWNGENEGGDGYLSFQLAYEETAQDLTRLVAVSDVFEGFGRVLAADVEEDFFAASVGRGKKNRLALEESGECELGSIQRVGVALYSNLI